MNRRIYAKMNSDWERQKEASAMQELAIFGSARHHQISFFLFFGQQTSRMPGKREIPLGIQNISQRSGCNRGKIYVLHPLREGNDHTRRELIGHLAQAVGHHNDWTGISHADMTRASINACSGDSGCRPQFF